MTAIPSSGHNDSAAPLSSGMKALTIWQPWASLIAEGVKTIETRSWPAPASLIGQRIAIHAAVRKPLRHEPVGDWLPYRAGDAGPYRMEHYAEGIPGAPSSPVPLPLGAIVATAVLADCLPVIGPGDEIDLSRPYIARSGDRLYEWLEDEPQINITNQAPYGDFTPGRWGWVLEEVHGLDEPIPAKGRQGVWRWQR